MERELLMFLGRACVESEIRISLPGRDPSGNQARRYDLFIAPNESGAVYRLGLAGKRAVELQGFAVIAALGWLGVQRADMRSAFERAVVELSLQLHEFFTQGCALLGSELSRYVHDAKDERAIPVSIFAGNEDPGMQFIEPRKP